MCGPTMARWALVQYLLLLLILLLLPRQKLGRRQRHRSGHLKRPQSENGAICPTSAVTVQVRSNPRNELLGPPNYSCATAYAPALISSQKYCAPTKSDQFLGSARSNWADANPRGTGVLAFEKLWICWPQALARETLSSAKQIQTPSQSTAESLAVR